MKGIPLLESPSQFASFCLAHRMEAGEHRFEVAYGSSFSELYYDFTPREFIASADRHELSLQLGRAGAAWVVDVLEQLASGNSNYTQAQLVGLARASAVAAG